MDNFTMYKESIEELTKTRESLHAIVRGLDNQVAATYLLNNISQLKNEIIGSRYPNANLFFKLVDAYSMITEFYCSDELIDKAMDLNENLIDFLAKIAPGHDERAWTASIASADALINMASFCKKIDCDRKTVVSFLTTASDYISECAIEMIPSSWKTERAYFCIVASKFDDFKTRNGFMEAHPSSTNVEGINISTKVTVLDLSERGIVNISGVRYLHKIKRLYLDENRIVDISPISPLVTLENLALQRNRIQSLEPLGTLVNLKTLLLFKNANIADVSPLATLSSLVELDISDCPLVKDITPLYNLPKLKKLRINSLSRDDFKAAKLAMPKCKISRW